MQFFTNVFRRVYREAYMIKVRVMGRFLGIEYISQEISHCSERFIALLLNQYGASVGNDVNFKANLYIENAYGDQDSTGDFSNLRIGNQCYIGKGVFFDLPGQIVIEDECAVSAGVKFITHADCGTRIMSKWYPRQRGKINIGHGSWIGVNAVILNNVTLGRCCVVAAGSVVTKSFPDFSVVAGVPAALVKTLKSS